MEQYQRNESAIDALETHLRGYGYAGSFQRGQLPQSAAAGLPLAAGKGAVLHGSAVDHVARQPECCAADDPAAATAACSRAPRTRELAPCSGDKGEAPVLLPMGNVLLGRIGAVQLGSATIDEEGAVVAGA